MTPACSALNKCSDAQSFTVNNLNNNNNDKLYNFQPFSFIVASGMLNNRNATDHSF